MGDRRSALCLVVRFARNRTGQPLGCLRDGRQKRPQSKDVIKTLGSNSIQESANSNNLAD
jgi:hypothetical protein